MDHAMGKERKERKKDSSLEDNTAHTSQLARSMNGSIASSVM
jgi:hypothetical protein